MNAAALGAHRARAQTDSRRVAWGIVQDALAELRRAILDVHGALVASVDGLPLAHSTQGSDPAAIAAMAATAAGLSKRIAADMSLGGFTESVVRGDHGYFVVYSVGRVAVLAVIASDGANLGRIHLEARRCAAKVAIAFEVPSHGSAQSL